MIPCYPRILKLLMLLLGLPIWPLALAQETQLEALHRNKRTLTTVCVEIQPSGGPLQEPYFMCKGADFQQAEPQQQQQQQQPQPSAYSQTPFPSFPSFGAGYFPSQESAHTPTTTTSGGSDAAFAPAPAAPTYGMPTVPYASPAGTGAAAHGTAAGTGATSASSAYADAAPKAAQGTASNPYEAVVGSRRRLDMDPAVLAMPQVSFQPEELQAQYRRPIAMDRDPRVGAAPTLPHPHQDDPIMRVFYSSLEPSEPLVAQAAPQEPAPSYAAPPPPPAPAAAAAAPLAIDGNACNSCARPCSASPPEICPSFQPVIIAMPCFGQQQPTHYLAMPAPAAQPAERQPSPYGIPYGMASPQVGASYGMVQPPFGMPAPQVGASFGMAAPQVGAPFGLSPLLNPFGPFGNLNPFNPFNRILGSAAPASAANQQPRLRLFAAPEQTPATTTRAETTSSPDSKLRFSSSTEQAGVGSTKANAKKTDDEDEEEKEKEEEEADENDATESSQAAETTETDAVLSKSVESKETADELLKKGEEKLKSDKRKRQNSRYNSSSSSSQKRKYLQRI